MTTVDDAVEAGAQVVGTYYAHEYAYHALIGAWPVLSAGLRELHVREKDQYGPAHCFGCSQEAQAWVRWPCRTVRELDRIDKELGL